MLAKGRLLGVQFLALLDGEDGGETGLYYDDGHAMPTKQAAAHPRRACQAEGLSGSCARLTRPTSSSPPCPTSGTA